MINLSEFSSMIIYLSGFAGDKNVPCMHTSSRYAQDASTPFQGT